MFKNNLYFCCRDVVGCRVRKGLVEQAEEGRVIENILQMLKCLTETDERGEENMVKRILPLH